MPEPEVDRERICGLQAELRYLLDRWDPVGVYDQALDSPPGEYDCLIGPVLSRLVRNVGRADLSEFLRNEVENHFGLDPVEARTDLFADSLLAWYSAKDVRP